MIFVRVWLSLIAPLAFAPACIAVAQPPITAVAFAVDGKHVVLGSQAGIELRTWPDFVHEDRLATELVHVHDLAFSPDGRKLLASGGQPAERGLIERWHWPEHILEARIASHADVVTRVAWSSDGSQWLTASSDHKCHVFYGAAASPQIVFNAHSRSVLAVAWIPDATIAVSAGSDQSLQVWDTRSGTSIRRLNNHSGSINDLAFRKLLRPDAPLVEAGSKQLPLLATASDDRTVRLWQPTIGRMLRFVRLPTIPRALAWSTDGMQLLVGCDDGSLQILDGETLTILKSTAVLDGPVYALAVEPDGKWAVAAGVGGARAIDW